MILEGTFFKYLRKKTKICCFECMKVLIIKLVFNLV